MDFVASVNFNGVYNVGKVTVIRLLSCDLRRKIVPKVKRINVEIYFTYPKNPKNTYNTYAGQLPLKK